jgi:anti-sigma regulatory factor (Ser/Thr protein kinase)
MTPGGQGLRLLYRFANSVEYERLADGNRLTLGFVV